MGPLIPPITLLGVVGEPESLSLPHPLEASANTHHATTRKTAIPVLIPLSTVYLLRLSAMVRRAFTIAHSLLISSRQHDGLTLRAD